MKRFKTLVVASLLCILTLNSFAQHQSSGTRFWIGFMENLTLAFNGPPTFAFRISSPIATAGNIIVPATGLTIPFDIPAGGGEITMPDAIWYAEINQSAVGKCILIETNDPVDLQAIHYRNFFSAGSRILPEDELGSFYRVLAAEDLNQTGPSEVVILATADNTTIEIVPSTITSELFGGGTPFTITLNAGQLYQIQAQNDLTNTTVSSINGEPIAVFAGAREGSIGCQTDNSHLYNQNLPQSLWGKQFALVPYLAQGPNIFKVLAGSEDTEVFVNCELIATLNIGETVELDLSEEAILKTTHPVTVGHFNKGSDCNPLLSGPSFAVLHPLNRRSTGGNFTLTSFLQNNHYVTFVVDSGDESTLIFDGQTITEVFQTYNANPNLKVARIFVGAGVHSYSCPRGVWAELASFDPCDAVTYCLPFNILTPNSDVNIVSATVVPNSPFCIDTPIQFTLFPQPFVLLPSWDFGDNEQANNILTQHAFDAPGEYVVSFSGYDASGCLLIAETVISILDCESSVDDINRTIELIYTGRQLQASDAGTLRLYAINGQLIREEKVPAQRSIDLSELGTGVYFAHFSTSRYKKTLRFFHEHE